MHRCNFVFLVSCVVPNRKHKMVPQNVEIVKGTEGCYRAVNIAVNLFPG